MYSGRTEVPSHQAHVRSLIVEPRQSDLLQAWAETPKGPQATVGRRTLVALLIYLRLQVVNFASGHGPGQALVKNGY